MSADIKTLPARRRPHIRQALPQSAAPALREPVLDVLARLTSGFDKRANFVAGEGSIAFDNVFARTTVRFTPVDCPTPDGYRVTEIAEVRTELPESLCEISDREMAVFNTVAALGALLRDPESGQPVIVSRASLLAGDEGMLLRYGMLLHAAALAHPDQLVTAFMLAESGSVRPDAACPRRAEDKRSPWDATEFEPVAARMRHAGLVANGGGTGLTAELPWALGEGPALEGDCDTSLLTLTATEPHPLFGDGMFCKLELPLGFPVERQVAVINALNQLESQAIDAPPFFGAWCAVLGTQRIAWVSFLLDTLYRPGLAGSLAAWMMMRHRFVREVICNRRA